MKKYNAIPWVICFLFFQNIAIHSQTTIAGKITDKETGVEMIAANIVVQKNGVIIQSETTDIDGNYSIRVDAGTYDMEVSYTGYVTQVVTEIVVNENQISMANVQFGVMVGCWGVHIWPYKIPLIKQDETSTGITIEAEKIKNLPTRNINIMPLMTPGVSFTQ